MAYVPSVCVFEYLDIRLSLNLLQDPHPSMGI